MPKTAFYKLHKLYDLLFSSALTVGGRVSLSNSLIAG